jgi:hypothetical protein
LKGDGGRRGGAQPSDHNWRSITTKEYLVKLDMATGGSLIVSLDLMAFIRV